MASFMRKLVSKKKKRFEWGGFDLDLSYITDRVIAMGYPSENFECLYRNKMSDVVKFLDTLHGQHYKVYNLCSERKYSHEKFHGNVAEFPFDDHRTPPIELVFDFCRDVDQYLDKDPSNIVVVHCKAGKGRTGTFISCYLIWCGQCNSATEAIKLFGNRRTMDGKGVTIPSQNFYVKYFDSFIKHYCSTLKSGVSLSMKSLNITKEDFYPPPRSLVLTKIDFFTIPKMDSSGGCEPWISISHNNTRLYTSKPLKFSKSSSVGTIMCDDLRISGDIRMEFYHKSSSIKMFSFYLNTFFVKENMTLWKHDLDRACKDKSHKLFNKNFHITIYFREFSEEDKKKLCFACKKPIMDEVNTISCEDNIWHYECATCCECHNHLGGKYTFSKENLPVCINCAQKTSKMPFFNFCAACNDVVDTDDFIEAQGFIWHRFCFCCSICKKLIDTSSYTHEYVNRIQPRTKNQSRKTTFSIGVRDSQQLRPSSGSMVGSDSSARWSSSSDKMHHPHEINLFCVECGAKRAKKLWQASTPPPKAAQQTTQTPSPEPPPPPTIITTSVSEKQSKAERRKSTFLVPNEVTMPVASAPPVVNIQPTKKPNNPPPETVKCDACSRPIVGHVVRAGTKAFHPDCFICSGSCKRPITDRKYYNGPNDTLLCSQCYQRIRLASLPICAACGGIIDEESATVAGDLHYHNSCFVCYHCKKELHGTYVRQGNNVYCPEDHDRLFGQVCTACHKSINGPFLKLGTTCYHQECLKCSECSALLTTMSFGRDPRTGAFLCGSCVNRHLYS